MSLKCRHCGMLVRSRTLDPNEFKERFSVGDKIKHHEWGPVWTITAIGEERFLFRNEINPKIERVSTMSAYAWIKCV